MRETIVIVDQVGWMGHHPMYNKLITKTFIQLGFSVILICEKPDEVISYLNNPPLLKGHNIQLRGLWSLIYKSSKIINVSPQSRAWLWLKLNFLQNNVTTKNNIFFINGDVFFRGRKKMLWTNLNKWSGIFMFPHKYLDTKTEMTGIRLAEKVFILDESLIDEVNSLYKTKNIFKFPDITYTDFKEVKFKKNRKKVIGIFGGLSKRKGFLTFLKISKNSKSNYQFLAVGRIIEDTFTVEERDEIRTLIEENNNLTLKIGNISDTEFNGYLKLVDLCYCVYENFRGSSNILTKSAYFHIPVIGLDNSYIGQMIKKYNIGATVNSTKIKSICEKMDFIVNHSFEKDNFDLYYSQNSLDKVRSLLEDFTL